MQNQPHQETLPPEVIAEPPVGASIPVPSDQAGRNTNGLDIAGAVAATFLLLVPLTMAAMGGS